MILSPLPTTLKCSLNGSAKPVAHTTASTRCSIPVSSKIPVFVKRTTESRMICTLGLRSLCKHSSPGVIRQQPKPKYGTMRAASSSIESFSHMQCDMVSEDFLIFANIMFQNKSLELSFKSSNIFVESLRICIEVLLLLLMTEICAIRSSILCTKVCRHPYRRPYKRCQRLDSWLDIGNYLHCGTPSSNDGNCLTGEVE